jgi:pectate lyase
MKNHSPLLAMVLLASFALPSSLHAATAAENLRKKPDDWFRSDERRMIFENILSWQTEHGDWPKNTDTTSKMFSGSAKKPAGTFDNGATTGELRALARAFRITGDERYQQAFLRGFDHILKAQYPNGGWPQFYPLSKEYHRHIIFNDGTMIRLMEFLREATSGTDYAFLDQGRRDAAKTAVERGIDCIVKCQVVVDGTPTAWCAQHDAETITRVFDRNVEYLCFVSGHSVVAAATGRRFKSARPD